MLATKGMRGIDVNSPITKAYIEPLQNANFSFVGRYVPRTVPASNDLTAEEISIIVGGGLAVLPVQHVESETSWIPSGQKGDSYGSNAGLYCRHIGIESGTTVWCDLEGVDPSIASSIVDAYCHAWFAAVVDNGFTPGLYVGWHCGLNPQQLYDLPFQHYWGAFNLNSDQEPLIRGLQLKQRVAATHVLDVTYDEDEVIGDELGGFPIFHL